MQCPRCRHDNAARAKFCEECAAPLAVACSRCGHPLPATARFCPECAQPVIAAAAASAPPRFSSPTAYTPAHLAAKILTSRSALEGERKQVTVLFADLKGSMELLADRDPEEARALLDPVLEHMMEAVHRFEGTVNQVMGDGIMALFGAPLAHEDHAVRACYAALRMQETVRRHAEELARSRGVMVRIRVGLNSGEVVVRAVGSDLRMDYTAVGQTTHLAARMEQLADPGTTLLTVTSLALAEGYIEARSRGSMPVKGLSTPIDVYELTGAGTARSRLQAAAARGLTRFVGRDHELDQLDEALRRAADGHGQVVAVVGEPGVGKSRLCWELTHSPRTQGWRILEGGSASHGKALAYQPIVELLKAYFQVEPRDDATSIRDKVTGKILALDQALAPDRPALLALLDVSAEDVRWDRLEPSQRRARVGNAVKRLLLRESRVQPLMALFEDLHWIDEETQWLLDQLVAGLPTAPLLLLVSYRPEYRHGWGSKTYYRQIRIDPLSAAGAEELLADLLGTEASLGPLKRSLIERTEGNPLFLEESVRALVETRVLVGARGARRPTQDVGVIQVPATVQAILAARIDRLDPDDKRLLQAASVIGRDVPFGLLQALAELPEADLHQALARLQGAELLYEARLFPDVEYTFKHALTHAVTYGTLLQEQRRTLHGRIATAIEELYADRLTEQAERLAYHALRGEAWSLAARYACLAGARAVAQARYDAARALYETAIESIDHQGDAGDLSLKLDAVLELWVARVETGSHEGFQELGEKADTLARRLADRHRLAQVRVRQAQGSCIIWVGPGGLETAIERAREALDLADTTDLRTRSYARWVAGAACLALGRFVDAIREFEAGVDLFAQEWPGDPHGLILPIRANLRAWQAEAYAALGEFAAAITAAGEARGIAERIEHPQTQWLAAAYSGHVLLAKGDIAAAAGTYGSGLAVAEKNDLGAGVVATALGLGHCDLLAGRHAQGVRRIPYHAAPGQPLGQFTRTVGRYGALKAGAYLAAGLLDEAEAEIAHGLELATTENARAYQVSLGRLRGELLATRGPHHRDAAARCWRWTLELAAELGARPELGHAHLGLGRLWRDAGARDRAREHVAEAARLYREMDMRFWLERAEAELGAVE